MQFQPLHCNNQTFQTILNDLKQFKQDDQHDQLVIKLAEQEGKTYIIETQKKRSFIDRLFSVFYKPENERIGEISRFIVRFFTANQDPIRQNLAESIHVIGLLSSVISDRQARASLNHLLTELETLPIKEAERLTSTANEEANSIIVEAKKNKEEQLELIQRQAQQSIQEAEKETAAIIESGEKEQKKTLTEAQQQQSELTSKITAQAQVLKYMEKKVTAFHDTIFLAKEGKRITTNLKTLNFIPMFKQYEDRKTQAGNAPVAIAPEDKEQYPKLENSFTFESYSEEALRMFLDFIDNPNFLNKETNLDSLIELYKFADYIGYGELGKRCLERIQINNLVDISKAIDLLNDKAFDSLDPLAQLAQKRVANNFKEAIKYPDFKKISSEQMLEILMRDDIEADSEFELFRIIKEWSKGQPGKDLAVVLNEPIHGDRLINHIRFENLSKDQFQQIVKENVVSEADFNKWSSFYLGDKWSITVQRAPRAEFICQELGNSRIKVKWRLPAISLSDPTARQSPTFKFKNQDVYLIFENQSYRSNYWRMGQFEARKFVGCRTRVDKPLECVMILKTIYESLTSEGTIASPLTSPHLTIGFEIEPREFVVQENQIVLDVELLPPIEETKQ